MSRCIRYEIGPSRPPRRLNLLPPPTEARTAAIAVPSTRELRRPRVDELQRLVLTAPGGALDPLNASELLGALHAVRRPLTLQNRLTPDAIDFALLAPTKDVSSLGSHLRGAMPDLDIRAEPYRPADDIRRHLSAWITGASKEDLRPQRDVESFGPIDPLAALLEGFLPLRRTLSERAELRYLTQPASQARIDAALHELYWEIAPGTTRKLLTLLEERLSQPLFDVLVRVYLWGADPEGLRTKAGQLESVFRGRFDASFGGLELSEFTWQAGPLATAADWSGSPTGLLLSRGELASFFHLPSSDRLPIPGLRYSPAATLLPQAVTEPRELILGTHRQRGQDVPAYLALSDVRQGHLVCLGRTGMGKTTLGHRLLRALAERDPQATIVLVDPHGDWAIDFARRSVPADRVEHTSLIELGNPLYPVGIPVFQRPEGVSSDAFIETTFSMIKLLFREQWSPTRLESAVHAAVSVLCQLPNATLLDLPRLFTDPLFRRRALHAIGNDPGPREFFAGYDALSHGAQRELVQPILYRLGAFTRARAIRNITCRTDGLNMDALIDAPSIVLVSASGQEIRSEADLLMEMLITRLHLALLGRLGSSESRRHCYLAIDEAQRIRGASLPVLLSEGRKTGLGIILLSQFLNQWTEALSEAVLGNVTTVISFAVGPQDSRRLAQSLKPYTPEQLENLSAHQAVVRTQVAGTALPAFDIHTAPLTAEARPETLERIRHQTRARFTQSRDEVERQFGTVSPPPSDLQETDDVYEA